jgi:hypothetical protein
MNVPQLQFDPWIEARAAEAEPNFLGVMTQISECTYVINPMESKLTP